MTNGKAAPRPVLYKELKLIERLAARGHKDQHIAEMLGRTEVSIKGIRQHYNIPSTFSTGGTLNKVYTDEENAKVNARLRKWVEVDRLAPQDMCRRLKLLHPPGLSKKSITLRLHRLGKDVWQEHRKNMRKKKAFVILQNRNKLPASPKFSDDVSAEIDAALSRMTSQGKTTVEMSAAIADAFGSGLTREAVVDRLHRLGLMTLYKKHLSARRAKERAESNRRRARVQSVEACSV